MCHQHVEAEQQDQHSRSVLQIAIQLAYHTTQAQQANHFEGTEQRSNAILVAIEGIEDIVWQTAEQIDDEP